MRIHAITPALVLFSVLALPAGADPKPLQTAAGVRAEAGIFCSDIGMDRKPAPGTTAGWINVPGDEPEFHSSSLVLPAVLGLSMGIKATATGRDLEDATLVVQHPAYPDGTTNESWGTNIRGGAPTVNFYSFDFEHELVPGPWRMQAQHDGKVLFDVTFEVVKPADAPDLARLCTSD